MTLYVPWLADAARSTGYRVVEVGGWRTRGHGAMRLVEGVVGHHTATPDSAAGDYPSLNIVTNGRSDLAGPLCNLGLGRDGTIYVIAAGCAWHAGASAWAGFTDLNDEFLGIEAESAGTGHWTAAQLDAYPKLVGALLKYMNRGTDRYAGHKDVCVPHGRKPDPVGIDTAWLRGQASNFMTGGGGGAASGGSSTGKDEIVQAFDYPNGTKEIVRHDPVFDTDGTLLRLEPVWEVQTKVHVFPIPVGPVSSVLARAWLSIKCAGGGNKIEYARLMSIASGSPAKYLVDQEFRDIAADGVRKYIQAADGSDQFTVMVRSAAPYGLCIETDPR